MTTNNKTTNISDTEPNLYTKYNKLQSKCKLKEPSHLILPYLVIA